MLDPELLEGQEATGAEVACQSAQDACGLSEAHQHEAANDRIEPALDRKLAQIALNETDLSGVGPNAKRREAAAGVPTHVLVEYKLIRVPGGALLRPLPDGVLETVGT